MNQFENIVWGGPTHKILLKVKLDTEPKSVIIRKIIFFTSFTWLPLLILSVIQSVAYNPSIKVSLLTDLVVWTRYFLALPLLFYTERMIRIQVNRSLDHFISSGIIAQNNVEQYESILTKISRIRDSKILEIIVLIIAYSSVIFYWRDTDKTNIISTWLFPDKNNMSLAGYWYYFIAAPLFQFFLYRMLAKFLLWAAFLYKVSRMDLNLVAINPDLSGGLNFLGTSTFFFGYIGVAQASVVSSQIAKYILTNKVSLSDFTTTIIVNVIVLLILFILPTLFFVKKLTNVRFKGILEYGVVSQKYVSGFHNKWVKNINPQKEELLGSADIQSLADLFNSFQIVTKMRIVPFSIMQVVLLILVISVPYLPLIFFIVPPLEVLKYLIGVFI